MKIIIIVYITVESKLPSAANIIILHNFLETAVAAVEKTHLFHNIIIKHTKKIITNLLNYVYERPRVQFEVFAY